MKNRSRAFTLVELLVVISIIALLLAILMPSLNKARNQAKTIKCAAQTRQMGLATLMYTTENKGALPYMGALTRTTPVADGGPFWFELLAPYVYKKSNTANGFYENEAYLAEYRKCPAGKVTTDLGTATGLKWSSWIGVVFCHSAPVAPFYYAGRFSGPFKVDKVKNSATAMLYTDVRQHWVYHPSDPTYALVGGSDGKMITVGAMGKLYNYAQPRIHNEGCNAGLLDGHVEYVKYEKLWQYDRAQQKPMHPFWNLKF